MSDFIQTNTIRERLQCPDCKNIFYIFKHKKRSSNVSCPCCGWNHSFIYPDIEGEK